MKPESLQASEPTHTLESPSAYSLLSFFFFLWQARIKRDPELRTLSFYPVSFSARLNTAIKIGAGGKFGLKVDFDPKGTSLKETKKNGTPLRSCSTLHLGNRGHYDDRLELIFEDTAAHTRFFIVRPLHAIVAVQADLDLLAPTAPYQKPKPRPKETETAVIDGPRPPQLAKISWVKDLPYEDIPTFLKVLVEDGTVGEKIRALKAEMLPAEVNAKTYGNHWQVLLWLEEIQAE